MISILTPTYNRAYILNQAYESLCRQTSFCFEWIIIDDGSTDNTEELVCSWQKTTYDFPIIYKKQENGGKHRAINLGVSLVHAEYVLILDSDDYLADNAVETIHLWLKDIKDFSDFAGVAGLRGWKNQEGIIGTMPLNSEYVDATNLQRKKFHLIGDKAEIYKTDILKKYPFPEFEGETFLAESAVWDKIAGDGYKIRWFNKIIYYCDYLEDGLTKNSGIANNIKNFRGFTYCTRLAVKLYSFPIKYLKIGYYSFVAKQAGRKDKVICTLLNINRLQLLFGKLIYRLSLYRKKWN